MTTGILIALVVIMVLPFIPTSIAPHKPNGGFIKKTNIAAESNKLKRTPLIP